MGFLLRGFIHFLALLPLPLAHRLGAFLGDLTRLLPHAYRKAMEVNLQICFPELQGEALRQFNIAAYREMGKAISEIGAMWLWPPQKILATVVNISGEEHLEAAMQAGKGCILAVPHLGCWEVVGVYCSCRYPMTNMYRPTRIADLNQLVKEGRQRTGATLVPTTNQGVKEFIQALKRNELVGMLPDQDPRNEGNVFADFFGKSASTATLLPRLANKTGAGVVFAYAKRLNGGKGYHIHFKPADAAIYDKDLHIAATAMNRSIESLIRENPEQYQWTYKRFKTRPPNEKKFY